MLIRKVFLFFEGRKQVVYDMLPSSTDCIIKIY